MGISEVAEQLFKLMLVGIGIAIEAKKVNRWTICIYRLRDGAVQRK